METPPRISGPDFWPGSYQRVDMLTPIVRGLL